MQNRFVRIFWGVTLLFLAGGAFLSARLSAFLLARWFWVAEAPAARAGAARAQPSKAETIADYRVIADRNLFNPHPAPPPPPVVIAPPIKALPTLPPPPPLPPPEPTLDVKVVGTAVVEGGVSYALIASGQDLRLVREGEDVAPGAILKEVRPDRILVSWRERIEEVMLTEGRPAAKAAVPGRPGPRLPPPPPPASPPPAADTVRQLGEDEYEVDAREVEKMRGDPSAMMAQLRVVPNFTEGQPDGFKVFAIRPGSLFAKIGLQNGDVIKKINGMDIQSQEQALVAYQRLSSESSIRIDLVRRSEAKTLSYKIH